MIINHVVSFVMKKKTIEVQVIPTLLSFLKPLKTLMRHLTHSICLINGILKLGKCLKDLMTILIVVISIMHFHDTSTQLLGDPLPITSYP